MAHTLTRARDLGLVLVGGALGGGARIALSEAIPDGASTVPWDLLLINVLGSFALGWVVARTQARGPWRTFPLVGPGFMGGFTTFSSIAALEWSVGASTEAAIAILAASLVGAVAAAALGWRWGDRPPTPLDEVAVFAEENE